MVNYKINSRMSFKVIFFIWTCQKTALPQLRMIPCSSPGHLTILDITLFEILPKLTSLPLVLLAAKNLHQRC